MNHFNNDCADGPCAKNQFVQLIHEVLIGIIIESPTSSFAFARTNVS